MDEKKTTALYKLIKWLVRLFYPRLEVVGAELLPADPAVIVGNHTQMNGPIAAELYSPRPRVTWCAGEMMRLGEVPAYAYRDFWSQKPRAARWFYKLLSYVIAPLSVCVFNNADTVPVYHDTRIITTFRQSIAALRAGRDVVIFPEYDKAYNNILYDFQDKFIDLARFYYKKTGQELSFVPMYLAPALRRMVLGAPIRFRADAPIGEERERIRTYLMREISELAYAMPPHRVVPYRNIPKRDYPMNRREEAET